MRRLPAAKPIALRMAKDGLALYTLFKPEIDELAKTFMDQVKSGASVDKAVEHAVESTVHKAQEGLLPGALTVEEETRLFDRMSAPS
jgi:hypothetical protein